MSSSSALPFSRPWFIALALAVAGGAKADSLTREYPARVAAAVTPQVWFFPLSDVTLLPGPFQDAMERGGRWMEALEPDRFLAWFRREAGLPMKGEPYGGWERATIAGHSLGHYLSGGALRFAATGDPRWAQRLAYIVDELAACQERHGDGFLAAYPRGHQIFQEEIARGRIRAVLANLNGLWVPWYVNHKVMAGLRDVYLYAHQDRARAVLVQMADWTIAITRPLTDEQWQQMLVAEYGGMAEVLADVYALTGEEKYLAIARRFQHRVVLEPLSERRDCLAGQHANTQIPKVLAAARLYQLTGEARFATISEFFWSTVVRHYTYANGGNSVLERFNPPDQLAEPLYHTTETCSGYNQLRLTRYLYARQPSAALMDYFERTLWNNILAHQNPHTGMIMYKGFLDMPARKKWSSPTHSFWCCVGTGFENHQKYAESIWAYDDQGLYLNQFIASTLHWRERGLTVRLETDFPASGDVVLRCTGASARAIVLRLRLPAWAEQPACTLNGRSLAINRDAAGYLVLPRVGAGDVVHLSLRLSVRAEPMPDKPDRMAFLYGPLVLAADLSGETQLPPFAPTTSPAPMVEDLRAGDPLPMLEGSPSELAARIERLPGPSLAFLGRKFSRDDAAGAEARDVRLLPLHAIVDQKYTVYLDTFTAAQRQARREEQQARRQEGVHLTSGEHSGRRWVQADQGGWLAFDLRPASRQAQSLVLTYWREEQSKNRVFDLLIDEHPIATVEWAKLPARAFVDVAYPIPPALTQDKERVRCKLAAAPGGIAGRIYGARLVDQATTAPHGTRPPQPRSPSEESRDTANP